MKPSDPGRYTDPALRDRVRDEITKGSKGGKPGQWSARKAQMVAAEYERQGGGFKHERDEQQRSLTEWGDEHWQTSDGAKAERPGGTTRYLPEKAWESLSEEEKAATNRKKREGSRQGKQFVANTGPASKARKTAIKKTAVKSSKEKAAATATPTKDKAKAPAKKVSAKPTATKQSATKKTAGKKASANKSPGEEASSKRKPTKKQSTK